MSTVLNASANFLKYEWEAFRYFSVWEMRTVIATLHPQTHKEKNWGLSTTSKAHVRQMSLAQAVSTEVTSRKARVPRLEHNIGAYTILAVPHYSHSIMGPKTLF